MYGYCNSEATPLDVACTISLGFSPACAVAGYVHAICHIYWVGCKAYCLLGHCCPKACGVPDPLHPGSGCCDAGDHCVDENDPNAREGCCPPERAVCGGHCCRDGEVCTGDLCCPPGTTTACNGVCCNGACTPSGQCCPSPSNVCGDTCCPPFNKCCNGQCCGAYQECDPKTGGCATPSGPRINPCRAGYSACGSQCCPPGKQCCIPPGTSTLGCYEPYECIH
jgi:hypothetical protein